MASSAPWSGPEEGGEEAQCFFLAQWLKCDRLCCRNGFNLKLLLFEAARPPWGGVTSHRLPHIPQIIRNKHEGSATGLRMFSKNLQLLQCFTKPDDSQFINRSHKTGRVKNSMKNIAGLVFYSVVLVLRCVLLWSLGCNYDFPLQTLRGSGYLQKL